MTSLFEFTLNKKVLILIIASVIYLLLFNSKDSAKLPRNAFLLIVIFGSFIGSMFVEQIYLITGSGGLLLQAITSKDYNIILFMVSLFSLITILSYTLRDILYELIDPRVRKRG